jgi:hypothetical protein
MRQGSQLRRDDEVTTLALPRLGAYIANDDDDDYDDAVEGG